MSRPRCRANDPLPPSLRAILSTPAESPSSSYHDVYTASSTGHQVGDGGGNRGKGLWDLLKSRAVGGQIGECEQQGEEKPGREMVRGRRTGMRLREGDIRGWFGVGKMKRKREEEGWKGEGGEKRVVGLVLAGREGEGVREDGGALCFDVNRGKKEREEFTVLPSECDYDDDGISDSDLLGLLDTNTNTTTTPNALPLSAAQPPPSPPPLVAQSQSKPLFTSLTIYISGATTPLISDHRLKHLLVRHGAEIAFSFFRRRVTHVVLGRENGNNKDGTGAGGGLAGSKIEREIRRVGGEGVRFVRVEWALESIKAGKRLPEARFAPTGLRLGGSAQRSVLEDFSRS